MKKNDQKELRTKSIKVAYSSRISRSRNPYSRKSMYELSVPKIQMEGKWLEKLGFHIGDKLNVEYGNGAIHITLAEPVERQAMAAESFGYMASEAQ